ncbi:BatD family protein [Luteimonas fraxinea]|uniref:BatD family protein n=1 Tax=Luteimonas fraxinea TaxID=2901869 RepID=A0ABS8UA31_9GAMM|nr:BatD family protein [Luteimonas fraxinea]MCD9095842.1 BatD family protein [Luteimonas fraxinea]
MKAVRSKGARSAAWMVAMLLLCCLVGVAQAQTRAWLDRDRIAFGETTTLNVETDGAGDTPDWAPLARDFDVSGHTSRREVEITGGRRVTRSLFGVALRPRREGVLTVPALQVGGARTAPLSLSVAPAAVTAARDGAPAFIEADIDVQSPYVQQSVGYVLRLYYATPLVSGSLDQPSPEGASMQRIGSDVQYSRDIDGRRYSVVERRYQIVPERSGTLSIPGARFEGRGAGGGMFDDVFNRGPRELSANGPPSVLDVRAMPANAPQPWLPLYGVQARWLEAPTEGRAGEASTFVLEAVFDGAVGTQLPEIPLPPLQGAQVFAEPPQYDESFEDGRPRVRLTRRYSVVPRAEGSLQVPGPRIAWWDVRAGAARTSGPPAVSLAVAAGEVLPGAAPQAEVDAVASTSMSTASDAGGSKLWPALAVLLAALWLATAWVAWRLYRQQPIGLVRAGVASSAHGDAPVPLQSSGSAGQAQRRLMHVLQTGEPADVEAALRALSDPPAADLDTLAARLDAAAQREAVGLWQRARWTGGDLPGARQALRAEFRSGASWRDAPARAPRGPDLPPLYPRR